MLPFIGCIADIKGGANAGGPKEVVPPIGCCTVDDIDRPPKDGCCPIDGIGPVNDGRVLFILIFILFMGVFMGALILVGRVPPIGAPILDIPFVPRNKRQHQTTHNK